MIARRMMTITASTHRRLSICIGLRRCRSEFDIVISLALLPDAMARLRPKIALGLTGSYPQQRDMFGHSLGRIQTRYPKIPLCVNVICVCTS